MSKLLYQDSTIHFGKHKGKTVQEVQRTDKSYLKWLVNNTDWKIKYTLNPKELVIPEKTKTLYQNSTITFGKHKGKLVKDLPVHYQKWIIEKTDYAIVDGTSSEVELNTVLSTGKHKGLTLAEVIRCMPEEVKKVHKSGKIKLSEQAKYTLYNNPKKALRVLSAYYPKDKIEGSTIDIFLDNFCKLSDWSRIRKVGKPTSEDF